jgi:hypothetical protein
MAMSAIGPTVPFGAPMSANGRQHPRRPRIEVRPAAASPEEAAAIAAAIEHFLRETAPAPQKSSPEVSPWLEAALYENAGLDPSGTRPWGGAPWR